MPDHIAGREQVLRALREELVGPSPQGEELDCSGEVVFSESRDAYKPYRQAGSGEEILRRDPPTKRYGVGVLYPAGTDAAALDQEPDSYVPSPSSEPEGDVAPANREQDEVITDRAVEGLQDIADGAARSGEQPESDDFDLSGANDYKPNVLGVSFLAEFPSGSKLVVAAQGGRYRRKMISVGEREYTWWLRSPMNVTAEFDGDSICRTDRARVPAASAERTNTEDMNVHVEAYARPHRSGLMLVTLCLVNRTGAGGRVDEACLFQTHMKATVVSPDGRPCVLPYPGPLPADEEEASIALLYRKANTYAVGHGCAADWQADEDSERAMFVTAECLPLYETPSITPDVRRRDGTSVTVSMASLAGADPEDDGMSALGEVVQLYEDWIADRRDTISGLPEQHRPAAARHIEECGKCARRMRDGITYLHENPGAGRAFQLANLAILMQQVRTRSEARAAQYDSRSRRIVFSERISSPDLTNPPGGRGRWRAFQIAFLLMTVRSAGDGSAQDRGTVELIWFPTGGGKTEAYLALAAFVIFLQRLRNPQAAGVNVLMRYTLRLLTAQQFQRASRLICAIVHICSCNKDELGEGRCGIGIWVGSTTTPNSREHAMAALRGLMRSGRSAENPFVLDRCPWCGAQMGPLPGRARRGAPRVVGYELRGGTVALVCPDSECEFSRGLPVYLIDEDIYEAQPSLIIGTVDKFAMLAWRPEARTIFGIGPDGDRIAEPPSLIIQDELHLISGPLGSMVGLYETAIADLCTDRLAEPPISPKIVCSTATVRRYVEQIRALYARDQVAMFPPPGLDASDSFFARYARAENGRLSPGRIYVGIHAPGLGSLQTAQVRTLTALLQAPLRLSREERDPWWTLLIFFNSLRELGTTVSLFQSDIRDYLRVAQNRIGIEHSQLRRRVDVPLELTARVPGEEVPKAISALETPTTSSRGTPVDVCLASSIIEAGVDIDRLSVMAVIGQPKTTSQYIQVTGRVGRRWWERPGLVATIYTASKPRDRSHFEKFRTYHERLYAQVEPTSVTPFSRPALDRALHAVMTCHARQSGPRRVAESPYPYPRELVARLKEIVLQRAAVVDPEESDSVRRVLDRRAVEWEKWERTEWQGTSWQGENIPMLRQAGAYVSPEMARVSWSTPMSMRNVDAECQIEITNLYLPAAGGGPPHA